MHTSPSTPSELEPWSTRDAAVAIAVAIVCALALHLAVPMRSYYGEPDAAAFAIDALAWLKGGIRSTAVSEYRFYSSPAYIWLNTQLLRATDFDVAAVAAALNRLNLIVSAAILLPVYLLFRRVAGSRSAAIAVVLASFIPTFYQAGEYGFPTLIGEFFLVWALWLYDRWLVDERRGAMRVAVLAAVCALLCLTILVKADVYIGAVALWGLMWFRGRVSVRNVLALCVIGAIPVMVLYGTATAMLVQSTTAAQYQSEWAQKFPFAPLQEINARHFRQLAMSFGIATLPVFIASLAWLARRDRWPLVLFLASWAALPILFWFFRVGDSARHHFPSSLPVTLGVSILLAALPVRATVRWAAVAVLVLVNYFSFPPHVSTVTTSGRLVSSGRILVANVAAFHQGARSYAAISDTTRASRELFVGEWRRIWYVIPEIIARSDSMVSYRRGVCKGLRCIQIRMIRDGRPYEWSALASTRVEPAQLRAAVDEYQREGFRVFTYDHDATLTQPLQLNRYRVAEYRRALPAEDSAVTRP